jgi:CsoR family transcriptional regulator, copper-sensing transcriptional repressor
MLDGNVREDVLKRLRRITGQTEGLHRMVDEGRYCIDILHQIAAVEGALHRAGSVILRNHLETCVSSAYECEDGCDKREKISELVKLFDSMRPK